MVSDLLVVVLAVSKKYARFFLSDSLFPFGHYM